MKRILVGTIIGMASEIFSVDGIEQVIGSPERFHVDAIEFRLRSDSHRQWRA